MIHLHWRNKKCLCFSWKSRIQCWTSMIFSWIWKMFDLKFLPTTSLKHTHQKPRTWKLPCKISFGSQKNIISVVCVMGFHWLMWPSEIHCIKSNYTRTGDNEHTALSLRSLPSKAYPQFVQAEQLDQLTDTLSVSQHTMALWFPTSASPRLTSASSHSCATQFQATSGSPQLIVSCLQAYALCLWPSCTQSRTTHVEEF